MPPIRGEQNNRQTVNPVQTNPNRQVWFGFLVMWFGSGFKNLETILNGLVCGFTLTVLVSNRSEPYNTHVYYNTVCLDTLNKIIFLI